MTTSVSSPYADDYYQDKASGCFSNPQYTEHVHDSSCSKHVHDDSCYVEESTKHKHVNACYEYVTCGGELYQTGGKTDDSHWYNRLKCKKCNGEIAYREQNGDQYKESGDWNASKHNGKVAVVSKSKCTGEFNTALKKVCHCEFSFEGTAYAGDQLYSCNNSPKNKNLKYFRSCGRTAGEIVSATIEY